jgi:hypothetical protein
MTDAQNNSNTIDYAIQRCEATVKAHRKVANGNLYFTAGLIVLFVAALFAVSTMNTRNLDTVGRYASGIDTVRVYVERATQSMAYENAVYQTSFSDSIRRLQIHPFSSSGIGVYDNANLILRDANEHYLAVSETIARLRQSTELIKDEGSQFDKAFIPLDKTILYIIYGVLIFLIGLQTSFYRFQLKEISKYEHFLFAFSRLRIAGNNYQEGFADVVRESLAKDAFVVLQEKPISKKQRVESPIPGHPGSDILTLLLNKIFENVEIKATPKKDTEEE